MKPIRIGIIGTGNISHVHMNAYKQNPRVELYALCDLNRERVLAAAKAYGVPEERVFTDMREMLKLQELDAVSVCTWNSAHAPCAIAALNAGKHVVTANKQLVAEKGAELLALAKKRGVNYLFEASVGGGIPVLHPLTQCMAANRIDEVYGILNGTTNYILTRMVRAGTTFADALKEAQEKGYAEADPTADVEGVDAGRKICILADLAFGCQVDPADVPMEGISRLSLRDVKIAQRAGYRVKLLGRAVRLPGGRTAYVAPHLIPEEQPLASVDDVFNAVVVRGNATGEVMFYGQGAGELPTASACVADVMEALQSSPRREEIGWEADPAGFEDPQALRSRYYFRIGGSLSAAAAAFGQVEILSEDGGETAFLTDCISGAEAGKQAEGLRVLACLRVLG